jgi:hypothetical protein
VIYLPSLAALLTSLARPTAVIAVPRGQTARLLVLDVSGSMGAPDLSPNRLMAAKQSSRGLIASLRAVGIGERGARLSLARGQPVGLDEATLQGIAEASGGQ